MSDIPVDSYDSDKSPMRSLCDGSERSERPWGFAFSSVPVRLLNCAEIATRESVVTRALGAVRRLPTARVAKSWIYAKAN